MLASLRGDRTVAEFCREHGIAESLLRKWRDQALEAAAERFESGQQRTLQAEQRRRIRGLERALGRKTYELEIAGEACHGRFALWGKETRFGLASVDLLG